MCPEYAERKAAEEAKAIEQASFRDVDGSEHLDDMLQEESVDVNELDVTNNTEGGSMNLNFSKKYHFIEHKNVHVCRNMGRGLSMLPQSALDLNQQAESQEPLPNGNDNDDVSLNFYGLKPSAAAASNHS